MMLDIVAYILAFAVAAGVVALGLERLAVRGRRPRRMVWALAMLASILLPPLLMLGATLQPLPQAVPLMPPPVATYAPPGIAGEQSGPGMAGWPATAAGSTVWSAPLADTAWQLPPLRARSLLLAWAVLSGVLLLYLTVITVRQARRAAAWPTTSLLGHDVMVSQDTGPALIGALTPRIVVPRWFVDEPAAVQSLILEHERQHMLARDPLLLRAGLLAVILMPWNLPLWWQWQRLRLAIEMDCDARVVGSGADVTCYAEVLLGVVQRAAVVPIGVVAMGEPASALERRIGDLLANPGRYAFPALIGASALAAFGVTLMFALRAPALPEADGAADELQSVVAVVPTSDLGRSQPIIDVPANTADASAAADPGISLAGEATPPVAQPVSTRSTVPRLLPPAVSSTPQQVIRALVKRYPELVAGTGQPGIIDAAIVLTPDGTLYRSGLRNPQTGAANGTVEGLSEIIPHDGGAATTALLKQGSAMPGGGTLKSSVALRYLVLPDDYDGSRSLEAVQSAVVLARPDLLLPSGGDRVNRVTVFMTEDGRVDRLYNEVRLMTDLRPAPPIEAGTWSPIFEPLGLKPEQLGRMGMTYAYAYRDGDRMVPAKDGMASGPDRQWIIVRYAWPRREGEPAGGFQVAARTSITPDAFDSTAALAIVQRHLPDVFTAAPPVSRFEPPSDGGIPAIALDRNGQVLLAIRIPSRYGMSPEAVRWLQSQLPSHVQLTRFVARPVLNAEGAGGSVLFAWDVLTNQEGY